MRRAYSVAAVRAAEESAIAEVGDEALMDRAATGLAALCRSILATGRGALNGARVVGLVGSGNNGGDTLFALAELAGRGVEAVAVQVAETAHEGGLTALATAGGRVLTVADEAAVPAAVVLVREADLVLDGVVGIGGSGAMREPAATLARAAAAGSAFLVAVDVPSGICADTGDVADPDAAFRADLTVTFGCLKPGLVSAPGRDFAGVVEIVDIGLTPYLPQVPHVRVLQAVDLVEYVEPPGPADHKYSRGVVGIIAGSGKYPGAALLAVGGARRSGVGMVRFADRDDTASRLVIERYPDVVLQHDDPADDPRVSAWAVGPGLGDSKSDEKWLLKVLKADVPVVIDADGLRMLARSEEVQHQLQSRVERGSLTVLTPHTGEFAALCGNIGPEGRVIAAKRAAKHWGCLILLKGSGTVVAGAKGAAYADPMAAHELATAGSGDVLTGLLGGLLAHRAAKAQAGESARAVAAAVFIHGLAARLAGESGIPVVATDIVDHIGPAVASLRGHA